MGFKVGDIVVLKQDGLKQMGWSSPVYGQVTSIGKKARGLPLGSIRVKVGTRKSSDTWASSYWRKPRRHRA